MCDGEFRRLMLMAECALLVASGVDAGYWMGYLRGLRRGHHGAAFGTTAEHERWLWLLGSPSASRHAVGRGYRDGVLAAGGVV